MNEQKPPTWVLACVAMLLVPVFYVLSSGPACWLSSRWGGTRVVSQVYRPLTWAAEVTGGDTLMGVLQSYSALGSIQDSGWLYNLGEPGRAEWISGFYVDWIPVSELISASGRSPLLPGDAETE